MFAPNSSSGDDWSAYRETAARFAARIADPHADASTSAVRARAAGRLRRLLAFLGDLDHPERCVPVVHVTGTSGKGSTAAGIATLLTAAGLKTGLATSPYLQVATEKLQIDGRLISGKDFRALLDDVEAAERRMLARDPSATLLSYGELWPALALRWFDREAVDVAVVEVGAGGRLDPTNVVRPVASVITGIGLDHVATLGPTLADIAWHKAGIIKPGAPAIVGPLPPEAWPVVEREASAAGVDIVRVAQDDPEAASPEVPFIAANQRLALATAQALADAGLIVPHRMDTTALGDARMPGRLETMPQPCTAPAVVLDGAHNPQKMSALVAALRHGRTDGAAPPVVVFGALAGKATAEMLAMLAPVAGALVTTAVAVQGKEAADAGDLAIIANTAGFAGPIVVVADSAEAITHALALAERRQTWVLVTGSLFLLGAVRGRWYPAEDVVRQRTPWPAHAGDGAAVGSTEAVAAPVAG